MKSHAVKISLFSLIAASLVAVPAVLRAQDSGTSTSTATATPAKHAHGAPFHGKVDGLDTNAMTLTVGSRTFQITSETRITNNGKPAILSEGTLGEPVTGYYRPADDGTNLNAVTVHFGKAAAAKAKAKHKKKATTSEMTATNAPPAAPPVAPPVEPPVAPPIQPPAMTPPPAPATPPTTGTNNP